MGYGKVIEAEAWGMLLGLQMAYQLNIPKIIVECDLELIVQLLNNGVDNLHPLKSVIDSCLQMKVGFEDCTVAHVYRAVNMVADVLSKCSLDIDIGTIYMEQPPPQVINAFLDDLSEVPRSRKVCNALS
ncbi:uncharacterized protein LOC121052843 [Rosa chinensis]|uniref:uncharacterized protein LOC121052843 n=1 Tax=Rosa chinensis TaxID=74649 RepID=UPI001AD8A5F1|nr:uncharacterized protein LOC121052843 [Rosa chinensis]